MLLLLLLLLLLVPFNMIHSSVSLLCLIALFHCSVLLLAYHCQIVPLVHLQHAQVLYIVV